MVVVGCRQLRSKHVVRDLNPIWQRAGLGPFPEGFEILDPQIYQFSIKRELLQLPPVFLPIALLYVICAFSFRLASAAALLFVVQVVLDKLIKTLSAQAFGPRHRGSNTMGSKRKHNQSSTAGPGRSDAQPSKKAKVNCEQSNALSNPSSKSSIFPAASPDPNGQAHETKQPEQDAATGISKSARKRLRKRIALREAKKHSLAGNKSEQATKASDGQHHSQKPLTKAVSGKPNASHTNAGSKTTTSAISGGIDDSSISHINKPLDNRSPPAEGTASSRKRASKKRRSNPVARDPDLQRLDPSASKVVNRSPVDAKAGISKRQRRRQSAQLKRDQASSHEPASMSRHGGPDHKLPDQSKSTTPAKASSTKQESPIDTSFLHQTTQTTLLPVPRKQWIDKAEHDLPVSDATVRKEVTKTSLMPRPTKEWVEEEIPMHAGDPVSNSSHAMERLECVSTGVIETSPRAAKPSSIRSPSASSAGSSPSPSTSPIAEDRQPEEVERPFAAVGLPPVTQPSATRPGINTIASFSLSSRRHPVEILAKSRKISGLSGMRMDTGMVGSTNKPVSSLKASSVPSYSGRGDVKAAFAAFNKFANGGESSDSDDESEESESEVEAETNKSTASATVAPVVAPSVSTEVRTTQHSQDGGEGQLDNTTHADIPVESDSTSLAEKSDGDNAGVVENGDRSASHDTQENDGFVAETPPNSSPNDQDTFDAAHDGGEDISSRTPANAPRMLGQQDLPLFSDFKAKHCIQLTDEAPERPATFLGQDLGGSISGPGPGSDLIGADQRISALRVPIGEYQASQEADELYRSIEDISREVFGSTRTLPDCKPPSNPLDVTTEPFVTDSPSGHGVELQSLEQKASDKDVALRHIARGSSPMVYIVGGVDSVGEATSDLGGDRLGAGDVRTTDSGPVIANDRAQTGHYSSPQTRMSSLTPSPTPPGGTPDPEQLSVHLAQSDNATNEDATIEVQENSVEVNEPVGPGDKRKRKMTGTSSKHFSPHKQASNQYNMSIKPESNEDNKTSILNDLEHAVRPSQHCDELPKPTKTKKKDTGKTSYFFTPTPSPTKRSPKSKSKTPRPPAGTSTCPVPPTTSAHFGLIQEKLWQTPFWLLIAVTFLNKTTGRSAVPIFRSLQTLYPTPELLAQANHEDLVDLIATLGLQNQRARKLVAIAKTWCEDPPVKGRKWRCLHYPAKGDGKGYKKGEVIEDADSESDSDAAEEKDDDDNAIRGALEIAHIPGCGPYAWDSWRIFCRDVLRGRAEDYNGKGCADPSSFEPEWQRVLPLDKELRACLRWMWLREGWVWDCESGTRRAATVEERRAGEMGEMEFEDEGEEKFAKDAAVVAAAAAAGDDEDDDGELKNAEVGERGDNYIVKAEDIEGVIDEVVVPATPATKKATRSGSRKMSIARRELDVLSDGEVEIPTVRRSRRNRAG